MAAPHSISSIKAGLRHQSIAARDIATDAALRDRLAGVLRDPAAGIAFIWPMRDEPDLRPLMHRLASERRLFLPVILGRDQPLGFRPWHPAAPMEAGSHGTRHPSEGPDGPDPDIILVPLVAFDRQRNRLGRGGGFYDRTLARHPRACAIGVAYATAEIPFVPVEAHDRPLDMIVTDRERI